MVATTNSNSTPNVSLDGILAIVSKEKMGRAILCRILKVSVWSNIEWLLYLHVDSAGVCAVRIVDAML